MDAPESAQIDDTIIQCRTKVCYDKLKKKQEQAILGSNNVFASLPTGYVFYEATTGVRL